MRRFEVLLAVAMLALPGCRRSTTDHTETIQNAATKPIVGAFGKQLGERWPDLPPNAQPRVISGLYIFPLNPERPIPGITLYRAWVLPSTMQICRLTAVGEFRDDKAFAEFFQGVESEFGHLATLSPAESFNPPQTSFWSTTREGRTILLVRRKDGRTALDFFDVFLGSRPLDEILSAKGAKDFEL